MDETKRLKVRLSELTREDFMPAFGKLASLEELDGRDKYALARTIREVTSALEDFNKVLLALFKQHGLKEKDFLTARLDKVEAQLTDCIAGLRPVLETGAKKLRDRLATIMVQNADDSYVLDKENIAAMNQYETQLAQTKESEITLYLDHRIKLPDKHRLTAADLSALIEFIEPPA